MATGWAWLEKYALPWPQLACSMFSLAMMESLVSL